MSRPGSTANELFPNSTQSRGLLGATRPLPDLVGVTGSRAALHLLQQALQPEPNPAVEASRYRSPPSHPSTIHAHCSMDVSGAPGSYLYITAQ